MKPFSLPFGIIPGSINVAKEKFTTTKNVMIPWHIGIAMWYSSIRNGQLEKTNTVKKMAL